MELGAMSFDTASPEIFDVSGAGPMSLLSLLFPTAPQS